MRAVVTLRSLLRDNVPHFAAAGAPTFRTPLASPRIFAEVAVLPLTVLAFENPERTSRVGHRVTLRAPFVMHLLGSLFT